MQRFVALALLMLPPAAFAAGSFKLSSGDVKPNATIAEAQVFKGFGCEGGNVSPALAWKNAPSGTRASR